MQTPLAVDPVPPRLDYPPEGASVFAYISCLQSHAEQPSDRPRRFCEGYVSVCPGVSRFAAGSGIASGTLRQTVGRGGAAPFWPGEKCDENSPY